MKFSRNKQILIAEIQIQIHNRAGRVFRMRAQRGGCGAQRWQSEAAASSCTFLTYPMNSVNTNTKYVLKQIQDMKSNNYRIWLHKYKKDCTINQRLPKPIPMKSVNTNTNCVFEENTRYEKQQIQYMNTNTCKTASSIILHLRHTNTR